MSSIVKGSTKWNIRRNTCQDCRVPVIPRSMWSIPTSSNLVPGWIRERLELAMLDKIRNDCSSGNGINTGPLPSLPTFPSIATIGSANLPSNGQWEGYEEQTKNLTTCTNLVNSRVNLCGVPCGGRSNPINVVDRYLGCRDTSPRPPLSEKTECVRTQVKGAGQRRTVDIKYRIDYCIYSYCSSGCITREFTVPRLVSTRIEYRSHKKLESYLNTSHCCRRVRNSNRYWEKVRCPPNLS